VAHQTVKQLPQALDHSTQCDEFDLTETLCNERKHLHLMEQNFHVMPFQALLVCCSIQEERQDYVCHSAIFAAERVKCQVYSSNNNYHVTKVVTDVNATVRQ